MFGAYVHFSLITSKAETQAISRKSVQCLSSYYTRAGGHTNTLNQDGQAVTQHGKMQRKLSYQTHKLRK